MFNNRTYSSNKNLNTKIYNRTIISAITLLLLVSGTYSALLLLNNASAAGSQVITGNTSSGENVPGWMFNRDATTSTPYEFNRDQNSGGEGSLYVLPITNTNTSGTAPTPNHDKFIAENFLFSNIADVNSISYDYMIGPNAAVSDANEFYMNVYANFGDSAPTKYYDCKYDLVPSVGSTGVFTTVTFNPNQAYPVTQHGSATHACPAIPAEMDNESPGSTIRMFALNVGDTSASDQGVDGYLDNVAINRVSDGVTTYDFEPEPLPPCSADVTTFDTFSLGSVNGQNGWSSTGSYDQAIENNEYGHPSLGCKTLRISNAVTTGAFGDQTFSYSTANEAGEVDSTNNGQSGGTRQNHFEAEFDVTSTQLAQQPGMALSISPDRGDGSRMSYLSFTDTAGGIDVAFYDTPGTTNPANFNATQVATLSRTAPHKVKFVIDYLDGPSNDVVKIYIDGALVHTGTTWENYYRFDAESAAEQSPRTTDSLIFRTAGTAAPANAGKGFLFDNVNLSTSTTPAPVAPTLISPANNSFVNASSPIANDWSDVAGADHYVYQSYNVNGSGNCNLAEIRFTSDYTASQTNSRVITDGLSFCWRVKTVNILGESAWSDTWKVTIDNSVPAVPGAVFSETPSGQVVASGGFTDSQNFRFNLSSASDTTRYQLKYWNDITGSQFKEASPWNPTDLAGYSSSLGVYNDNFTQGNGVHYFAFSACDAAGNCSSYGAPFVVTFDNQAPDAPQLGVQVDGSDVVSGATTNNDTITALWNKPSTDTTSYIYAYWNDIPLNPYKEITPWTTPVTGESRSGSFTEGEGTHYLKVRAVDAGGNLSDWSNVFEITYDNTAPVVTLNDVPDSDDTTPTLTGTISELTATVTLSINGGTPQAATVNPDNTWTYTVDPALTTGDYTVTVAATDSAGNGTTPAPTDDFTVTEPVVVVTQTQGGDGAGGGTGTDGGTGGGGGGAGAPAAFFAGFIAGGAGGGDGAGDGAPADQAVAGDTNNANDTNGNVRAGDNAGVAAATTDQSGWRFNWWWLLILAALVAAFYGWYRYRQAQADKTL